MLLPIGLRLGVLLGAREAPRPHIVDVRHAPGSSG